MSTLKEVITAFEYRKNAADAKVKIGYQPDKFKVVSETYEEVLRDLRRVNSG